MSWAIDDVAVVSARAESGRPDSAQTSRRRRITIWLSLSDRGASRNGGSRSAPAPPHQAERDRGQAEVHPPRGTAALHAAAAAAHAVEEAHPGAGTSAVGLTRQPLGAGVGDAQAARLRTDLLVLGAGAQPRLAELRVRAARADLAGRRIPEALAGLALLALGAGARAGACRALGQRDDGGLGLDPEIVVRDRLDVDDAVREVGRDVEGVAVRVELAARAERGARLVGPLVGVEVQLD